MQIRFVPPLCLAEEIGSKIRKILSGDIIVEVPKQTNRVSTDEQEKEKSKLVGKTVIKKESKSNLKKKRFKAFLFNHKKIATEIDSTEVYRKNYLEVKDHFINEGFTNIKVCSIKDIYKDNTKQVGEVERVEIDGISSFNNNFMCSYDSKIIIIYHQKKNLIFRMIQKNARNYIIKTVLIN